MAKPAARLGDLHVCPIPGHGTHYFGVTRYLDQFRVGDVTGCGAVITAGFPLILAVVTFRPTR